ncbi:MAG: HD domain-containing protein [Bacilli bacterium]|jgi:uncharacterized protein
MKIKKVDPEIVNLIIKEGQDILTSKNMLLEQTFVMHKGVTTFDHSIGVAYVAVNYIRKHHIKKVDLRSIIRGALLHDFFLYNWHDHDKSHRFHGFIHAKRALKNAEKEFSLNKVEKDIIVKHMFPLTLALPCYKESFIVSLADKKCAIYEIRHKVAFKPVPMIKKKLFVYPNMLPNPA